jgi:predicted RNA-binding Zn ribbon-like protein
MISDTAMSTTYQLLAGHPALDFVNTLDNRFSEEGPRELMNSYTDLLSFSRQAGLLDQDQAVALATREELAKAQSSKAAAVLRSARELREGLAGLLYMTLDEPRQPPSVDMKTLQRHFLRADEHRELVWGRDGDEAPRAQWQWGSFASELELPVWAIARSAASLLTSTAMDHVRMCGSETCRWLFYDTSKNHSRRWCDMKLCGNRMKARRFQKRRD